jgi:hypothetical protein
MVYIKQQGEVMNCRTCGTPLWFGTKCYETPYCEGVEELHPCDKRPCGVCKYCTEDQYFNSAAVQHEAMIIREMDENWQEE